MGAVASGKVRALVGRLAGDLHLVDGALTLPPTTKEANMTYKEYTRRLTGLETAFNAEQKASPPQTDEEREGRRKKYHDDVMDLRREYEVPQ
jgi:hypothetical protein